MMSLGQVTAADVIGLLGVIFYVAAYGGLALGRLSTTGLRYYALNAVGALLMIYSLVFRFNLSSFVSQLFWLVFTLVGFIRARSARG